jgi:hypothetical protein
MNLGSKYRKAAPNAAFQNKLFSAFYWMIPAQLTRVPAFPLGCDVKSSTPS